MSFFVRPLACLALSLAASTCLAQAAASAVAASAPRGAGSVERTVIEDDGVRIEETRLRGTPQRIKVQSKIAHAAPYEIIVAPAGRDASQQRGAAGQSAWPIFSF